MKAQRHFQVVCGMIVFDRVSLRARELGVEDAVVVELGDGLARVERAQNKLVP